MSMIMAKRIISRETIKPLRAPHHLNKHNLSLLDQHVPNLHLRLVFFYQNYRNDGFETLKKSLSQCLTQYYPFAGRMLDPSTPYIDCNDLGVEFLEASIDSQLHDFIFMKELDETIDQLIPNGLGSDVMLEVQLNHFTCGGAAVAMSISHKLADACTIVNFVNHWATLARGGSPVNPTFFSSPESKTRVLELKTKETSKLIYGTKRFVFPNSKLNELKKKVNTMGIDPINPTRVEALTSLLFRCAVGATKTKSGCFQPSNLSQSVNLRKRMTPNLPELAAGNFSIAAVTKMSDLGHIELNEVITNLRKEIIEYQGVTDVEEVSKKFSKTLLMLGGDQNRTYYFSSLCRFPFYEVDFGWGFPERVTPLTSNSCEDFFLLMDTPRGDGIEAIVKMEIDEMRIFEKNEELLAYVEDI